MPSTDLDSAKFTRIDWSEESGSRVRSNAPTVGLLASLVGLAGMLAYDYTVRPEELLPGWDFTRTDWLLVVSALLFVRYAVYPLVANRERSGKYVREFLRRPGGVLSFLFILGTAVLGLFGAQILDFLAGQVGHMVGFAPYPKLEHRLQPPVFTSVYVGDTESFTCVGYEVNGYCKGTFRYPLGTTRSGNSVLKHMFAGMRIAMKIGLSVAMIMGIVATVVGTTAGYFGGWVDDVLMGYVDVQQTIPAVVVYVMVATLYFGNLAGVPDGGLFSLVLVFGLLDWGGIARLVRSETLKRRSSGYVRAARAAGASDLQVIRRHVIPNTAATIVTALTRRIPLLILAQVALAYLSLNRIESESIGRLLRMGLGGRYMPWYKQWWVSTFAVLFLVGVVVSFNVFGDTVRDVLEVKEGVE